MEGLLCDNAAMNIYDDETFFSSYIRLREGANYNDLLETPAMLSLLGSVEGKDILDLGCGFGKASRALIDLGARKVMAIDSSKRMLEKARNEYGHERIEYMNLPLEELDRIEGSYDAAYSSLAFHYIEDLRKLLCDIGRLLKVGGMLLFSQEHPISTADYDGHWNEDSSEYAFSGYLKEGKRESRWFVDGVRTYHRTMGTIITTLSGCGFQADTVLEPAPSSKAIEALPRIRRELEKPSFLIVRAYRQG